MRIQHNIPAMAAYRNYSNNTSAVAKNLEKLSSGYKINRAGDDAAGLAISEKMRAQISGLEQAQSNAKSGINLIQTAEGALTEVHDMLNRMYTLAEQSSNGTYDDSVDRVQLQKEIDSLRTEINRIADSSNFNGINLLDGSLCEDGVKALSNFFQLPEVGANKILGTDTVLHQDDDETAAATSFSLDLHNVTFKNELGNALKIKVGEYTFTYTASTDADAVTNPAAEGAEMDADAIAAAFQKGEFKLDGVQMIEGMATLGDAEFKVEVDTEKAPGRITFTQTNSTDFDPRMEVSIFKSSTTELNQGRAAAPQGRAVGDEVEETPVGSVSGTLITGETSSDAAVATKAQFTSDITFTTAPAAGNVITLKGGGLAAAGKSYTVVDDSAEDFDAASFDANTQVKASDLADADGVAAWIAGRVTSIDNGAYTVSASGNTLTYEAAKAGAIGSSGPASNPTGLTIEIVKGSATAPVGTATVGAVANTTPGVADVAGTNGVNFSSTDTNFANLSKEIAKVDSAHAITAKDAKLTVHTYDDNGTTKVGLYAGDTKICDGEYDSGAKTITFKDTATPTANTLLTLTFTDELTNGLDDLKGHTIDTNITIDGKTPSYAVDGTNIKSDLSITADGDTVNITPAIASGNDAKLVAEIKKQYAANTGVELPADATISFKAYTDASDSSKKIGLYVGDVEVATASTLTGTTSKVVTFKDTETSPSDILTLTFADSNTKITDFTALCTSLGETAYDTGITVSDDPAYTATGTLPTDNTAHWDDVPGTAAVYEVEVDMETAPEVGNTFKLGDTTYTVVADDASPTATQVKVSDIADAEKLATWIMGKAANSTDYNAAVEAGDDGKYKIVYTAKSTAAVPTAPTVPAFTSFTAPDSDIPVGSVTAAPVGAQPVAGTGTEAAAGTSEKKITLGMADKNKIAAAATAAEAETGDITIQKYTDEDSTDKLGLFIGGTQIATGTISGTALTFADADGNVLLTANVTDGTTVADVTGTIATGLSFTAAADVPPEVSGEPVEVVEPENKPAGVGEVTVTTPAGTTMMPGDIKMSVDTVTKANPATGLMQIKDAEGLAFLASISTGVNNSSLNGMNIKIVKGGDAGAATAVYDDTKNELTVTLGGAGGADGDGKYTAADIQDLIRNNVTGNVPGDLSNFKFEALTARRDAGTAEIVFDYSKAPTTGVFGEIKVDGGAAAGDKYVNITATDGTIYTQTVTQAEWDASLAGNSPLTISAGGVSFELDVKAAIDAGVDLSKPAVVATVPEDETAETPVTGDYNKSTTVLNEKKDGGGDRLASTWFNLSKDMVADGATITIASESYTFSTGNDTNVPKGSIEVDISDLDSKAADYLSKVAERLTNAAGGNKVYTVGHDGNRITVTETKAHAKLNEDGVQTDADYPEDGFDLRTFEGIKKSLSFSGPAKKGKELTLQIGDTADTYNQLKVSINDCHAAAMGIGDIDIGTQEGASDAMDKIKKAINYVSDVRGTLGATQNRLDHTINNLSVMAENIQDAESTIRDVDVAKEMMEYTKNNILVQSAQAMLAQANQLPQGVLQLLG